MTPTYEELLSERDELAQRIERLQAENKILRDRLGIAAEEPVINTSISAIGAITINQPTPPNPFPLLPPSNLSLQEKVALFQSIFRGREDVFAKRWYSRSTNKSGYQPVCANEWNPQLCDKKKHKCADCPNRQFAPLTYEHLYRHLEGKDEDGRDVIGLYAVLTDNTCYFLCADFDDKNCEHGYQSDVLSYVSVCKDWGLQPSIERSRSGNGAHVWLFFETPILAAKARRLGSAILTEATNRDGKMSFKSYDRFFPNQDALSEGGLGNLVALPLQGKARRNNNSVFVDETFTPYNDQWTYLQRIQRISETQVDTILKEHSTTELGELSKTSESKPWETPKPQPLSADDFPQTLTITRSNALYIPIAGLSARVLNHLKRLASFRNPEFYSRQAMHFSTFTTPRIITCAEMEDDYLILPRGCEDELTKLLTERLIPNTLLDETQHGTPIQVTFNGILRPDQEQAQQSLLHYTNGTLSATTAFGKTVTAASLIAKRQINTLILVHSKALLDQWQQTLSQFLTIDYTPEDTTHKRGRKKIFSPIGTLDSNGNSLHGIIDIALMQSCLTDTDIKPFVRNYGMVIVDECHHVSAVQFERVLKFVNAQYVYGLTATPIRKDGHQPIIFMQCGPIRYTADAKKQIAQQSFSRELIPRFTSFRWLKDDSPTFAQVAQELAANDIRNQLIIEDVRKTLDAHRTPLILTNLTSHVETMANLLRPHCPHVVTLVGSASANEKRETMAYLQSISPTEPLAIVATGKYVGEGFDFPRLDTLFLAMPVSWKGIVAQYSGRLHRDYPNKTHVQIYDYVDIHVPLCEIMYRRRLKGYAAVGYQPLGDATSKSSSEITPNRIYNGGNYLSAFHEDVLRTTQSIVISAPKWHITQCAKTLRLLQDLMTNGVSVRLLVSDMDNATKLSLEQLGFLIQPNPTTLRIAILDRKTIWYGGINYLSSTSIEENAMRLTNPTIADDILNILVKD